MLTGRNKDVDRLILSNLDDRSLLQACQTNKYASELCRDESFWRNRFIATFKPKTLEKPDNMTWKHYYLETVTDIDEMRQYFADQEGIQIEELTSDLLYKLYESIDSYLLDIIQNGVTIPKMKSRIRNTYKNVPEFGNRFILEGDGLLRDFVNNDVRSYMFDKINEKEYGFSDNETAFLAGVLSMIFKTTIVLARPEYQKTKKEKDLNK